jgi:hypothetical protein
LPPKTRNPATVPAAMDLGENGFEQGIDDLVAKLLNE